MATRKVKLRGIGYWAKVFEDNRDQTGFEDAKKDIGGQTSIDVDLDKDNMALLNKSRSMKRGSDSKDNPGLTRVKFTRDWTGKYVSGPPKVVKADGTDWDYDVDGPIGNGSEVEVVLSVYDTSRKSIVGTRLDKVKVLVHVPYDPDGDDDDDTGSPPVQTQSPPTQKARNSTPQDMDDEIPFE